MERTYGKKVWKRRYGTYGKEVQNEKRRGRKKGEEGKGRREGLMRIEDVEG